jgi:two-component system, OmpR family, response regulator ArlR
MRILIAEDERELARGLKYLLEKNNFTVDLAADGQEALELFACNEYDALVLDIMMPKKNGLEVLSSIRRHGSHVPVMMLTAKAEIEDRVLGLESGADDYLPKPFATKEFIARVKALARRSSVYTGNRIQIGNTCLDCSSYELVCGSSSLRLNNKEYQLAELFFKYPDMVFSVNRLMDRIWGADSEANMDVVWTYIGFLRRKLKDLSSNVEIKTVRGAGYILEAPKC